MLFKRSCLLTLAASLLVLTGCATIVDGKSQAVTIQSTPEGATVSIDGNAVGVTPVTLPLERKDGQVLRVTKDGYTPYEAPLTTQINGWFFGNILIGGFLGSTTDGVSGAMHEYAPNQYLVPLEPVNAGKVSAAGERSARDKAREYVIISYSMIIGDVRRGQGEYLQSLYGQLQVAPGSEAAALTKIRTLADAYPDVAQFAGQLSTTFLQ